MKARLLIDGATAFPQILEDIKKAQRSIEINMFIWRDDRIGNVMGEAVLAAAQRGVKIFISADKFGGILEKAEEARKSFFHKKLSPMQRFKASCLARFYPHAECPPKKDELSQLYLSIINHPNITVQADRVKKDHSKFYVFDERVLIMGGINVEDKENGADMQGRVYRDYMVRLEGEDAIAAFRKKMQGGEADGEIRFVVNDRKRGVFEVEGAYLDMINRARERIILTSAYLSVLPKIFKALKRAGERGVKVDVLIPQDANLQNDCNRRAAKKLLKACPSATLYLCPKMVHAKALLCDGEFCFGSANFNGQGMRVLGELNLWGDKACPIFEELAASLEENLAISKTTKKPNYRPLRALLEGLFA